jgi:hypothetical protein
MPAVENWLEPCRKPKSNVYGWTPNIRPLNGYDLINKKEA